MPLYFMCISPPGVFMSPGQKTMHFINRLYITVLHIRSEHWYTVSTTCSIYLYAGLFIKEPKKLSKHVKCEVLQVA